MRVEQEKVRQFMEFVGDKVADVPTNQNAGACGRRYDIIKEELDEYIEAALKEDLVGVADSLGDLLYTVLGLANLHGLDARAIFEEVHRSNMTKTPMLHTPNGKLCIKGPNFEKPRIAELLLNQLHPVE